MVPNSAATWVTERRIFRREPSSWSPSSGPQAAVVARALQRHGAVVSDSGPHATLAGEPDLRWDNGDLRGLGRFTLADFEVVDPGSLVVDPASHRIRR